MKPPQCPAEVGLVAALLPVTESLFQSVFLSLESLQAGGASAHRRHFLMTVNRSLETHSHNTPWSTAMLVCTVRGRETSNAMRSELATKWL